MTRTDTSGRVSGLGRARATVRALPGGRIGWRIAVTLVGLVVIVLGIVLLALPGPGWLIIFAGLGVLATEYPWAARLLARVRDLVRRGNEWAQHRSFDERVTLGVLSVLVLVGIGAGAWYLSRLI